MSIANTSSSNSGKKEAIGGKKHRWTLEQDFQEIIDLHSGRESQETEWGVSSMCQCPCHDDNNASLSVAINHKKDSLRFTCFAGCDYDLVRRTCYNNLEVHRNKSKIERDNQKKKSQNKRKRLSKRKFKEVARYGYKNENDELDKIVVRVEYLDSKGAPTGEKDFRCQSIVNGKEVWGFRGKPLLYHLPMLRKAIKENKTVFLVEGEKDADRIITDFGLVATTNMFGASKWEKSFSAEFEGAKVVICVDDDYPGIKRGEISALRLLRAGAKKVKLIPPFKVRDKDPGTGADISDWLDDGGSLEELQKIIKATPYFDEDTADIESFDELEKEDKTADKLAPADLPTEDQNSETNALEELGIEELVNFDERQWADFLFGNYRDKICYIPQRGLWATYKNGVWKLGKEEILHTAISEIGHWLRVNTEKEFEHISMWSEEDVANKKIVTQALRKFNTARMSRDLYSLCKTDMRWHRDIQRFDSKNDKIAVKNGVVDLRTGELLEHSPEYGFTKRVEIDYDPSLKSPRMLSFMKSVFPGDKDMLRFMYKWLGYCMSGETKEQCFSIFFGYGSNGKSSLIKIMTGILGDYCGRVDSSLVVIQKAGGNELSAKMLSEIAQLAGCRFIHTTEISEFGRLNSRLLKDAAEGAPLPAKMFRQDPFQMKMVGKWNLQTNHQANISAGDKGIWRRVRQIDFDQEFKIGEQGTIQEIDKWVLEEKQAVFTDLVRAATLYYREGLRPPEKVIASTEEYAHQEDWLARFLEDCCVIGKGLNTSRTRVYSAFKDWAESTGEYKCSAVAFGKKMSAKNFVLSNKLYKIDGMVHRLFHGVALAKTYRERLQFFATGDEHLLDAFEDNTPCQNDYNQDGKVVELFSKNDS